MKILVTGGAGFIGSNFVRYMLSRYDDVQIVNMDVLTYAGNLENLADVEKNPRYCFVHGNIASEPDVAAVFGSNDFDVVVNFAAESHVDRSLHVGALDFVTANIYGVQMLLDACMRYRVGRFLQISTDEVYGSLGPEGSFTESSTVRPANPYAATKAAADLMIMAACKSHGLDAVITRCSNNYGPYQFPEKMIPLMIANALDNRPLPVYGDGLHSRDWLYVLDHCSAIDAVLRNAPAGALYNIGSGRDIPNIDMVKKILSILGKPESLIAFVNDRPGHDRRYAMNAAKIHAELGWRPAHTIDHALKDTVDWYLNNRSWLDSVRSGAYIEYYKRMYGQQGCKADQK